MADPWTPQQIVTAAIAAAAAVISLLSLSRTWKLQRQQMLLQTKQEELIDLQLESLRNQATITVAAVHEEADVRVDLDRSGNDYKFIITNWGRGPARTVRFDLDLREGRRSPFVQGDYDEKIPIPELAPGARCALFAALTYGTGTTFPARWSWHNPDGSEVKRASLLTI